MVIIGYNEHVRNDGQVNKGLQQTWYMGLYYIVTVYIMGPQFIVQAGADIHHCSRLLHVSTIRYIRRQGFCLHYSSKKERKKEERDSSAT